MMVFLVTNCTYDHIQNHFRAIAIYVPHLQFKDEIDNDQIRKDIDIVGQMRLQELAKAA